MERREAAPPARGATGTRSVLFLRFLRCGVGAGVFVHVPSQQQQRQAFFSGSQGSSTSAQRAAQRFPPAAAHWDVCKTTALVHAAIEHRRDPFTSSYCFVFKGGTTRLLKPKPGQMPAFESTKSGVSRLRRSGPAADMASFRARQRASYAEDSMMINDGWCTTENLGMTCSMVTRIHPPTQ